MSNQIEGSLSSRWSQLEIPWNHHPKKLYPDAVIVAATVMRWVSLVLVKISTVWSPIFDSVFFKCIEKYTPHQKVECEPMNIPRIAKLAEIQPFKFSMDYLIMSQWWTLFNLLIQSFEPHKWAALDLHFWWSDFVASFCKALSRKWTTPCKK